MSVPTAWLDEDGRHVWSAHYCTAGREVHMLPWPTWQATKEGVVEPSYSCGLCGLHTFLRINRAAAHLEARRADRGFQARLRERMAADQKILRRLADTGAIDDEETG